MGTFLVRHNIWKQLRVNIINVSSIKNVNPSYSLVFSPQNKRQSWCTQCSVRSAPTVEQPEVYFPIPIYPNLSPRTLPPLVTSKRICFPKWNSEVGDTPSLFTYSYALLWWGDDVFCQFKRWIMAGIYQGRPDNGAGPRRPFTRSDWLGEFPCDSSWLAGWIPCDPS